MDPGGRWALRNRGRSALPAGKQAGKAGRELPAMTVAINECGFCGVKRLGWLRVIRQKRVDVMGSGIAWVGMCSGASLSEPASRQVSNEVSPAGCEPGYIGGFQRGWAAGPRQTRRADNSVG